MASKSSVLFSQKPSNGDYFPGVNRPMHEADHLTPSNKSEGKGKVVPALKKSTKPCRRMGRSELQLHAFFDLGTRWRWVVSFTPRPLYPRGKRPWYPLSRRLGGPQSRSGRGGVEKNSHPLPAFETLIIQPVVQRYNTELPWLLDCPVWEYLFCPCTSTRSCEYVCLFVSFPGS
jgi:hypothetical protein